MKYTVLDYRAEGETVTVVALKGYPTTKPVLPDAPEGVARVWIESVEDLRSLGAPVLDAVHAYKAKKGAEKPAEHDETAEAVWAMLNPPPRKKPEKISGDKELQSSADDGTSPSVAGESGGKKETRTMKTKAKKASKKVAKKANGASKGPRGEKTLKVKAMLERKSGCTREQVLEATGWPAISMQAISKAAGLKLRVDKTKRPYTYFGS